MVLCLFIYFLAVHFDWSIILIRKSFGASRHISGKLGVKLAIHVVYVLTLRWRNQMKMKNKKNSGATNSDSLFEKRKRKQVQALNKTQVAKDTNLRDRQEHETSQ